MKSKTKTSDAAVEAAIEETASRANQLLFDAKGKRRPDGYYIMLLTLHTVLRPATLSGTLNPPDGHSLFDWDGTTYVYDAGISELFLASANTDPDCARVLCNAAAVMLEATGRISDPRLRAFACGRLTAGMVTSKRKRGRSSKDTRLRDAAIIGRLIPPLLDRFSATRNKATRSKNTAESACSIVTKALSKVRHNMTEKRVEDIWGRRPKVLAK